MKIKLIIGSLVAVTLLTLVSFSNVVGYQSIKSDTKTNSPLFSIRSNKGDISSNYLGKGNSINLLLPKRDSEAELFEKNLDNINAMDDKTFDKFVRRFIACINLNNVDNVKVSNEEIKDMLFQIKSNPDAVKNSYMVIKEEIMPATMTDIFCMFLMWVALFILILLSPILIPLYIILSLKDSICMAWGIPYQTFRG